MKTTNYVLLFPNASLQINKLKFKNGRLDGGWVVNGGWYLQRGIDDNSDFWLVKSSKECKVVVNKFSTTPGDDLIIKVQGLSDYNEVIEFAKAHKDDASLIMTNQDILDYEKNKKKRSKTPNDEICF